MSGRPGACGSEAVAASAPIVGRLEAAAYTIPTDRPEADGTLAWDRTTLVVVHAFGGGRRGLGYTYADPAAAAVISDRLDDAVRACGAMDVPRAWQAMRRAVRNIGSAGIAACAISAVDAALWDLKARLLDLPLALLLGRVHDAVPLYGSGGFTTYDLPQLQDHLRAFVEDGIPRVKMKVGSAPGEDAARVRAARAAIGDTAELFVDANGAYSRKQALAFAHEFRDSGVSWFEEPVSSDDVAGLRLLRDSAPPGLEIAAGEYAYGPDAARRLLEAGAVDVLQLDATRCLGITGFLQGAALCEAYHLPLSAHTAPALHLHACCAVRAFRHLEYFHDHVRIERRLFDGAPEPRDGRLAPDLTNPGLGLQFRHSDAEAYRVR